MDQNKLRKLAGLPFLREYKEIVDAPTNAKAPEEKDDKEPKDAEVKDKKDEKEELPSVVTSVAQKVCDKFGIGDPEGGPSEDLDAVHKFLMQVYEAGVAEGGKAE